MKVCTLIVLLVFHAAEAGKGEKKGSKAEKKAAKRAKKAEKAAQIEEENRGKFNGEHFCNITDYLYLSSVKEKDCTKSNKNCGPDAICPDEQCQIHCRSGNKRQSYSTNCRCKKDKNGKMNCNLKTSPRIKLKALIRQKCENAGPLNGWRPTTHMDKPPKPDKPWGKPEKPSKPDKPARPTKPTNTGTEQTQKPEIQPPVSPTTVSISPTKPIKPEHVGHSCPTKIMTYSPVISRAELKMIDLSTCDNSNNPGSICETKCSSLYEETPGDVSPSYYY